MVQLMKHLATRWLANRTRIFTLKIFTLLVCLCGLFLMWWPQPGKELLREIDRDEGNNFSSQHDGIDAKGSVTGRTTLNETIMRGASESPVQVRWNRFVNDLGLHELSMDGFAHVSTKHSMRDVLLNYTLTKAIPIGILKAIGKVFILGVEEHFLYSKLSEHNLKWKPVFYSSSRKPVMLQCHWEVNGKLWRQYNVLRPFLLEVAQKNWILVVTPGTDYVRQVAQVNVLSWSSFANNSMSGSEKFSIHMDLNARNVTNFLHWSGLSNLRDVINGGVVVLGYVQELASYLKARKHFVDGWEWKEHTLNDPPAKSLYGFGKIVKRGLNGNELVKAVFLGYKHTFWGDLARTLLYSLYRLGASEVLYAAKLASVTDPSDVYNVLFLPTRYILLNKDGTVEKCASVKNSLRPSEIDVPHPVQLGTHASIPTVIDETDDVLRKAMLAESFSSIDDEIGYMAQAADTYHSRFGSVHFATDYINRRHENLVGLRLNLVKTSEKGKRKMIERIGDVLWRYLLRISHSITSDLTQKLREVYAGFKLELFRGIGMDSLNLVDHFVDPELVLISYQQRASQRVQEIVEVNMSSIFSGRQRVIVEGHAGAGKTTLCKLISQMWAKGIAFNSFDVVLFVELSKVAEERTWKGWKTILEVAVRENGFVPEDWRRFSSRFVHLQVLLIFDGLDEVEDKGVASFQQWLRRLCLGTESTFDGWTVMISTRSQSTGMIRFKVHDFDTGYERVQLRGFSHANVRKFVQKYAMEKSSKELLLRKLESEALFFEVCQNPLTLELVCHIFMTGSVQKLSENVITLASIYRLALNGLFERASKHLVGALKRKVGEFDTSPWVEVFGLLAVTDRDEFSLKEVDALVPREAGFTTEDLLRSGVLSSANMKQVRFVHPTFADFFQAFHRFRELVTARNPRRMLRSIMEGWGCDWSKLRMRVLFFSDLLQEQFVLSRSRSWKDLVEYISGHSGGFFDCCRLGLASIVEGSLVLREDPGDASWFGLGRSCLFLAAENGHGDVVDVLIKHKRFSYNPRSAFFVLNGDPVEAACGSGSLRVVERLLRLNMSVTDRVMIVGTQNDNIDAVAWALEHGIVPPADLMNHIRSIKMAKMLIDVGVVPRGNLVAAIREHRLECILFMLDNGLSPNTLNEYGEHPVAVAAREGNVQIVTALLMRGGDADGRSPFLVVYFRLSALFWAGYNGNCQIVELLLAHNAMSDLHLIMAWSWLFGSKDVFLLIENHGKGILWFGLGLGLVYLYYLVCLLGFVTLFMYFPGVIEVLFRSKVLGEPWADLEKVLVVSQYVGLPLACLWIRFLCPWLFGDATFIRLLCGAWSVSYAVVFGRVLYNFENSKRVSLILGIILIPICFSAFAENTIRAVACFVCVVSCVMFQVFMMRRDENVFAGASVCFCFIICFYALQIGALLFCTCMACFLVKLHCEMDRRVLLLVMLTPCVSFYSREIFGIQFALVALVGLNCLNIALCRSFLMANEETTTLLGSPVSFLFLASGAVSILSCIESISFGRTLAYLTLSVCLAFTVYWTVFVKRWKTQTFGSCLIISTFLLVCYHLFEIWNALVLSLLSSGISVSLAFLLIHVIDLNDCPVDFWMFLLVLMVFWSMECFWIVVQNFCDAWRKILFGGALYISCSVCPPLMSIDRHGLNIRRLRRQPSVYLVFLLGVRALFWDIHLVLLGAAGCLVIGLTSVWRRQITYGCVCCSFYLFLTHGCVSLGLVTFDVERSFRFFVFVFVFFVCPGICSIAMVLLYKLRETVVQK